MYDHMRENNKHLQHLCGRLWQEESEDGALGGEDVVVDLERAEVLLAHRADLLAVEVVAAVVHVRPQEVLEPVRALRPRPNLYKRKMKI